MAAYVILVRTTMLSSHLIENILRFQVQDKHNASSFSLMTWIGLPLTIYKNTKKVVIISLVWSNYYYLMSIISAF